MAIFTVIDQNDSKFGASSLEDGITRCEGYAKPGDTFRVYQVDDANPYPGFVAARVECDNAGTVTTETKQE